MSDNRVIGSATSAELEAIRAQLESSLQKGWHELRNSELMPLLREYLAFLQEAGFYESQFRQRIPNPAYDYAARLMGRPFMDTARHLNLAFDQFPGEFSESEEFDQTDHEVRRFFLIAYRNGSALCRLAISFPHRHDTLEFPLPPNVALVSVY